MKNTFCFFVILVTYEVIWCEWLNLLHCTLSFLNKDKKKQTKETKPLFYLTWIAYCLKKDWHWNRVPLLFKGFPIFILHCVRNSQVSLIWKVQIWYR